MSQDFKKLFNRLHQVEPVIMLKNKIITKVRLEDKRRARVRIWSFGTLTIVAFGTIFASANYLYSAFLESGFYQYFSLVFSGDVIVSGYWTEFMFSLAESVPLASIAGFLIALAFFVWSGANVITNTRRFTLRVNY